VSRPGVVDDLSRLQQHQGMHTLQLDDAYGLDPEALPDLPPLRHLVLNGTRRTIVASLGRRFRGGPVKLPVHGAKSQAWLAAHMDNPFRDWVQESKAFGQAACKAYTRAWRVIEAIEPDAPDRRRASPARPRSRSQRHSPRPRTDRYPLPRPGVGRLPRPRRPPPHSRSAHTRVVRRRPQLLISRTPPSQRAHPRAGMLEGEM